MYGIDSEDKARLRKVLKPFFTTVKENPDYLKKNAAKVELGKALFFDTRLSKNSDISCNSCHDLQQYGTNGVHYKKMLEDGTAFRDVPSIYNLNSMELFNWDGSQKDLYAQVKQSLTHESEMAMDEITLIDRLKKVEGYKSLFEKAYPDKAGVSYENVVDSLVVFLNGLVTPSPVDRFIDGDDSQLTDEQIVGGQLFD